MLTIVLPDDPELLRAFSPSIEHAGHGVRLVPVRDASELLDRVTSEAPDLVVLTARVGDSGGADLAHRLKTAPATCAVPLLFVGPHDAAIPADGFVPVPMPAGALVQAALRLLPRRERAWERARAAVRVDYFVGDEELVGTSKDLGCGGLFLRGRRVLESSSETDLLFDLPGPDAARIRARGRVVRVVGDDREPDRAPGMGVEFVRIGERDREAIRRFVERGTRGSV